MYIIFVTKNMEISYEKVEKTVRAALRRHGFRSRGGGKFTKSTEPLTKAKHVVDISSASDGVMILKPSINNDSSGMCVLSASTLLTWMHRNKLI